MKSTCVRDASPKWILKAADMADSSSSSSSSSSFHWHHSIYSSRDEGKTRLTGDRTINHDSVLSQNICRWNVCAQTDFNWTTTLCHALRPIKIASRSLSPPPLLTLRHSARNSSRLTKTNDLSRETKQTFAEKRERLTDSVSFLRVGLNTSRRKTDVTEYCVQLRGIYLLVFVVVPIRRWRRTNIERGGGGENHRSFRSPRLVLDQIEMDNDSTLMSNSNWKSGLCWGNLAGCLAFYHTLTGLSLSITNSTFLLLSTDYPSIFASCLAIGLIIVLLGVVLLPLVFSCILGRRYHIYAAGHAYITFLVNLTTIALIALVGYEVSKVEAFNTVSSRFLLTDLALLILTALVGLVAWISYVGRQFHEPNGQFILQLWTECLFEVFSLIKESAVFCSNSRRSMIELVESANVLVWQLAQHQRTMSGLLSKEPFLRRMNPRTVKTMETTTTH